MCADYFRSIGARLPKWFCVWSPFWVQPSSPALAQHVTVHITRSHPGALSPLTPPRRQEASTLFVITPLARGGGGAQRAVPRDTWLGRSRSAPAAFSSQPCSPPSTHCALLPGRGRDDHGALSKLIQPGMPGPLCSFGGAEA